MSNRPPRTQGIKDAQRLRVVVFCGGRGAASIVQGLLADGGFAITLLINGYDDGQSTGQIRRFLGDMLGPSDFRKAVANSLTGESATEAGLKGLLELRLPVDATWDDVRDLAGALRSGRPIPRLGLPASTSPSGVERASYLESLLAFASRESAALPLANFAVGNLLFAGCYLQASRDFNRALKAFSLACEARVNVLNVSDGNNLFLVALKHDGTVLGSEAEVVAPQTSSPIEALFLLPRPLDGVEQSTLAGLPGCERARFLEARSLPATLSPEARAAIVDADLLVYGPGTPHSSLFPSYAAAGLTPALAASRARARVLAMNLAPDNDIVGRSAQDLAQLTLGHLGDRDNLRRSVTHVVCDSRSALGSGHIANGEWITTDVAAPQSGVHDGVKFARLLHELAAPRRAVRRAQQHKSSLRHRCLFFDRDGTLLDSERAHAHAFAAALRCHHLDAAAAFDYQMHRGLTTEETLLRLGIQSAELRSRVAEEKRARFAALVEDDRVGLFPGVRELLLDLARRGRRLFLVTNGRASGNVPLARAGLIGVFEEIVTVELVQRGKPWPDMFERIIRNHELARRDCLAIDDTAMGIEAARCAHIEAVLVHSKSEFHDVPAFNDIGALHRALASVSS